MSTAVPPPLPSPSVGIRRKGAQALPRLPLSAFTPPNSGSSDRFPLPPSPSAVHPEQVVDAHVVAPDGDLSRWKAETGQALGSKLKGVVVSLNGNAPSEVETALKQISSESSGVPVLSALAPLDPYANANEEFEPPLYLANTTSSKPRIAFTMVFTKCDAGIKRALGWTLSQGLTVNIDVECNIRESERGLESLEELLTSIDAPYVEGQPKETKGKIIISNILPPTDDLSLPIVKLLTHPSYREYQSHIASISLRSNVFINFLPPSWGASTPSRTEESRKEWNEWKRRLKMYIGPVVEAFGYQRIIFGSSPSTTSQAKSNAGDWYELARECFAELGVEQEGIDAVFSGNALLVYS
ncbi:hypothetical protein SCP_0312270 [Sparassis crispa]|uniref:Amidohydrolase-related domain-containing protein n=1 Tax=Sparassis crispa TaxID=139825 RepID=A0A401GH56_9APHY|nr:hypothetical protein SCP_0312270 [Sparassis crispa]GBE81498.1 hypothetical protein SCP_0312270 [Sparassis crispa]